MYTLSISREPAAQGPKTGTAHQNFSLYDVTSIHTLQNNSAQEVMTNEEWPEIFDDGKIGECIKVNTKQAAKEPKTMDIVKNISHDDLESIRRDDPFMYYSIPGVRRAKLLMNNIDLANLGSNGLADRDSSSHSSSDEGPQRQKVSRSTCISFECHPDLLLQDLMDYSPEEDLMDYSPEESTMDAETLMNILIGDLY